MVNCTHCGTTNPPSHNFCTHCGELLGDRCPRCSFEVDPPVNFCGRCGLALTPRAQFFVQPEPAAPGTDFSIPGAPVRPPDQPPAEPPAHTPEAGPTRAPLDQYIPRELRAKLEAARARGGMEGERRVVTMLFCDVKGSTEAAGRLDPEDWTEIINGAFEYMIRPVYKYEGTVARLMGDGILAFFGAPIAHEDDPQRAVLTGLDIVGGLGPYREQIRQRWGIEINVRIGINTGLVVVGAVGSDLRMEYTAMGDAINLAARMEQTAAPGTIQVAQDTYKHVARLFDFEDLGGIQVKGKDEPVPAYRVLGRKADAVRTRGIEGLEADLVGRSQELERLREIVDSLDRGLGRIVCLLGGAGLGKSRLIRELRKLHPPESGAAWVETACISYESGDPYAVFQRLMRRMAGISAAEEAEAFWEKIEALSAGSKDPGRTTSVFSALFDRPDPEGRPPLEGEHFKRALFAVMAEVWERRFADQPGVLVLDDLHWADPASIDLLLHLLPVVERSPVVLLCAFRPDREAPVYQVRQEADSAFPHRYTEIVLRPLSPEEGDEMVDRLLTVAELPDGLRGRIRERAAGNPFYVEEVVRTLIEKGAVVPEDRPENGAVRRYWRAVSESAEIEIPDNLQGLLASRIDRLEEATRQVVQLASVIGRSFYHRVLAEIGGPDALVPEEIDAQVGRLVRLEMIQEAARVPEVEYRFRNPMTQEIAYQTILLKRRREFHRRVGAALETLFPERQAELISRLAHHFTEAQEAGKALEYSLKAGDHAYRLFALEEALRFYEQALAWAERGKASDEQLVHLHLRKGRTLELLMRAGDAIETYRDLEALGQRRGSDALRLAGLASQAVLNAVTRFDIEKSVAIAEQALDLARRTGDRYTEARSLWSLLLAFTWVDAEKALAYGNQGLAIAREMVEQVEASDASSEDVELLALLLVDLTIPLVGLGQVPTAREYADEARALFEQLGNVPMASTAAQRQGIAHRAQGNYVEAEAAYHHSVRIDRSIGNHGGMIGNTLGLADIYPQLGKFDAFLESLETLRPVAREARQPLEIIDLYPVMAYFHLGAYEKVVALGGSLAAFLETDNLVWPDVFLCYLVRAKIALGEVDEARRDFAKIRYGANGMSYMIPLASNWPQVRAELALAEGSRQEALEITNDFIERVRRDGMLNFIPEKLVLKGRILRAAGKTQAAREALREAFELAEAQQARLVLWQAGAHLAELAQERGDEAGVQRYTDAARAAVEYIAEHAGSDELREAFLALPRVRAVLGEG